MKKIISAALALGMLACLAACGSTENTEELNMQEISPIVEAESASESSASAMEHEAPASDTNAAPQPLEDTDVPAGYVVAQEYIGRTAAELVEAIGEPESSQYAASCEVDGGEDGMLFYDGFYVWTIRTAEEELVRAVYLDE